MIFNRIVDPVQLDADLARRLDVSGDVIEPVHCARQLQHADHAEGKRQGALSIPRASVVVDECQDPTAVRSVLLMIIYLLRLLQLAAVPRRAPGHRDVYRPGIRTSR